MSARLANASSAGSATVAEQSAAIALLRPVDLGHLNRYTLGNRALEREVLQLFAGQIWQTFSQLKAATTERDWRRAAHTVKGSARAIGAWQLGEAAERLESISPASADRAARVAALEREVALVTRYIEGRG